MNGSVGRVVGFYKPREAVAMGAQIALPESRDQGLRKAMANGDDRAAAQGQRGQGAPDGAGQGGQASAAGGALDDPQREQKLKTILALNTVWPAVQFQQGPLMLCVPLSFEVVNADANIEAVREQVSVPSFFLFLLSAREIHAVWVAGAADPGVGVEYPQVAGADPGARASRPQPDLREGTRCVISAVF